jgi:hypothetical protein
MARQNAAKERIDQTTDEAFAEIARIAQQASQEGEYQRPQMGGDAGAVGGVSEIGCSVKKLPTRLTTKAAELAARINPTNAALMEMLPPDVIEPLRLTVLTTKYWGAAPRQFSVSFMDNPPADLRARIISHLNAWSQSANKTFAETAGTGEIRIARGPSGYWSYLGLDVLLIPPNRPTMNLQGFTMGTADSEFRRVIRHEAGHTLGFPHEHMRRELVNRIDPEKAYAYFWETQGWDKQMVDQQVLTPLNERSIFGTPADQDSIMCYRLPAKITRDGQPIRGGADINRTDFAFAGLIYPKAFGAGEGGASTQLTEDWDPSEDVMLTV